MGNDISLKEFPTNYVVVDIETTGLSCDKNEIIELSALKIEDGEIKEQFSELVKPKGHVSKFITNLTGITPQMLENAADIKETLKNFNEFCKDSVILGHNVKFDLRFINANMQKHLDKPFENDFIDTLKIARKFLSNLPSRRLGYLADYFEFNSEGMHRALKDCVVTNLCYKKFLDLRDGVEEKVI